MLIVHCHFYGQILCMSPWQLTWSQILAHLNVSPSFVFLDTELMQITAQNCSKRTTSWKGQQHQWDCIFVPVSKSTCIIFSTGFPLVFWQEEQNNQDSYFTCSTLAPALPYLLCQGYQDGPFWHTDMLQKILWACWPHGLSSSCSGRQPWVHLCRHQRNLRAP